MFFFQIIRLFEKGNVCVCGLRGAGKDMLTSNVVARRKQPYVSNIDYTQDSNYNVLDFSKIDCGKNSYMDLVRGKVKYYKYPYPSGSDIYISDAGIYLPSQYCNELNRDFKYLPTYFALSRQVSHNNVHINVQNLNRLWDKCREMSDIYIRCRFCKVLFGKLIMQLKNKYGDKYPIVSKIPLIVLQSVTLYDKYQSAVDRVEPCRIRVPITLNKQVRQNAQLYLDKFYNTYGSIRTRLLVYVNKSIYDTFYFEKLFLGGSKNE